MRTRKTGIPRHTDDDFGMGDVGGRSMFKAIAEAQGYPRYDCRFNARQKTWTAYRGRELIAKWSEADLPGLGRWIRAELISLIDHFIYPVLLHRLQGSDGGWKSREIRRKNSKKERAKRHIRNDPAATNQEIAERVGCDRSLVWLARQELGLPSK